ncbi:hypothetical protein HN51_052733 [Arachis hypogaea]|nr:uncharacterized protein DS421_17g598750 [Arachis hypogaea]
MRHATPVLSATDVAALSSFLCRASYSRRHRYTFFSYASRRPYSPCKRHCRCMPFSPSVTLHRRLVRDFVLPLLQCYTSTLTSMSLRRVFATSIMCRFASFT